MRTNKLPEHLIRALGFLIRLVGHRTGFKAYNKRGLGGENNIFFPDKCRRGGGLYEGYERERGLGQGVTSGRCKTDTLVRSES